MPLPKHFVHVIPPFSERDHLRSMGCWCIPHYTEGTVVHNEHVDKRVTKNGQAEPDEVVMPNGEHAIMYGDRVRVMVTKDGRYQVQAIDEDDTDWHVCRTYDANTYTYARQKARADALRLSRKLKEG